MRLIVSSYLRTLRERDEFDRLLPDLVMAMGYTPLVRPQAGVRQYGVDLPAVGRNPGDGVEELLLFVIKQGDIGRSEWSSTAQSVRQSLDEIIDVYLRKHVDPAHLDHRKRIILATTGDLKQDTQQNWNGFVERHQTIADFDFWSGDKVADLVERHMLDEHVFHEEDRVQIRKALAFAGEPDYSMVDLDRLLTRQLGLSESGEILESQKSGKGLAKAITRLNLALRMFAKAAQDAGDTRQALWAAEHFLLKTWHRLQLTDESLKSRESIQAYELLQQTYFDAGAVYLSKIAPHAYVRDGMSGYTLESAEYAVVLLEHVGLIASVGLAVVGADKSEKGQESVKEIADILCAMLVNMPATASPRLDENAIDVSLALLFLASCGRVEQANGWLFELQWRFLSAFALGWGFPVSSDSFDDLVDITVNPDENSAEATAGASWLAATLATWLVVYEMKDEYEQFVRGLKRHAVGLKPQLWHPDAESSGRWYFEDVHLTSGNSEVIDLPGTMDDLRERMDRFLDQKQWDVETTSSAFKADLLWLDFLKSRHYRFPVSARIWYPLGKLLKSTELGSESEEIKIE